MSENATEIIKNNIKEKQEWRAYNREHKKKVSFYDFLSIKAEYNNKINSKQAKAISFLMGERNTSLIPSI